MKFGSGFPTNEKIDTSVKDEEENYVYLNNIQRCPGNLFSVLSRKCEEISGVTSPWVYMGMLFASFCWHVEDLFMLSVNYMHLGEPKTWLK